MKNAFPGRFSLFSSAKNPSLHLRRTERINDLVHYPISNASTHVLGSSLQPTPPSAPCCQKVPASPGRPPPPSHPPPLRPTPPHSVCTQSAWQLASKSTFIAGACSAPTHCMAARLEEHPAARPHLHYSCTPPPAPTRRSIAAPSRLSPYRCTHSLPITHAAHPTQAS